MRRAQADAQVEASTPLRRAAATMSALQISEHQSAQRVFDANVTVTASISLGARLRI
jgi:hypothetical protein